MNFTFTTFDQNPQIRQTGSLPLFDKSFDPAHDGLRVTLRGVIQNLSKGRRRIRTTRLNNISLIPVYFRLFKKFINDSG
ncbi:MAG: hypothetical protein MAGBODY4_00698 [Candidatus Marinimicrobia bacterium]|nr:hypothetical protein [Candidatus Neomarinimicrobiota bacterium]